VGLERHSREAYEFGNGEAHGKALRIYSPTSTPLVPTHCISDYHMPKSDPLDPAPWMPGRPSAQPTATPWLLRHNTKRTGLHATWRASEGIREAGGQARILHSD